MQSRAEFALRKQQKGMVTVVIGKEWKRRKWALLQIGLLAVSLFAMPVGARENDAQADFPASASQAEISRTEVSRTEMSQIHVIGDARFLKTSQESRQKVKKGWKWIGGKKYYRKENGKNKTGWFSYNGHRFYLDPKKNGAAATGVRKIQNKYYCFNEKGRLVKDRRAYQVGENYYAIDAKGRAKKLSETEKQAVLQVRTFSGSRLRNAFEWAAKLPYQSIDTEGKTPQAFASHGFTYKRGDCNVQACTFYYMAKVLGYDAHFVKGVVPQANGKKGKHAWVEIDYKGMTYVFDPNLAGQYASKFGKDTGWKFQYGAKNTYKYQEIKRVN